MKLQKWYFPIKVQCYHHTYNNYLILRSHLTPNPYADFPCWVQNVFYSFSPSTPSCIEGPCITLHLLLCLNSLFNLNTLKNGFLFEEIYYLVECPRFRISQIVLLRSCLKLNSFIFCRLWSRAKDCIKLSLNFLDFIHDASLYFIRDATLQVISVYYITSGGTEYLMVTLFSGARFNQWVKLVMALCLHGQGTFSLL